MIQNIGDYDFTYDDSDAELVLSTSLFILRGRGSIYATHTVNRRTTLFHRTLLGLTDKTIRVDHINRNTFDNRRENLRLCTAEQNTWNRKLQGGKNPNKTGYRGTYFNKRMSRWFSSISVKNKPQHLGYFSSVEECARAYDKAAIALRGKWAILNFPEEHVS